jgi:hypothetical protein
VHAVLSHKKLAPQAAAELQQKLAQILGKSGSSTQANLRQERPVARGF